jgi:nucleotide-binding universal stress UspA family protein
MLPIQTILCPVDFSDCSRLGFQLAGLLAQQQRARLIILHVKETLGPIVAYGEAMAYFEAPDDEEKLRELLEQFQPSDSEASVEHRLEEGDIVRQILWVADETRADLIVMGSHGRTGLQRLVLGSVAEQVIRKAHCPVLTVKLPRTVGHGERSARKTSAQPDLAQISVGESGSPGGRVLAQYLSDKRGCRSG